jgi:hypothetical protein
MGASAANPGFSGLGEAYFGLLSIMQSVYFQSGTTSPIPEPDTYAMMLMVLALLGFVSRRSKQQAA